MTALLVMADGPVSDPTATRIDLLKILTDGIGVEDWIQAVREYKEGGIFQSSSLSDGRQLVSKRFDTTPESFPISCVRGSTQDIAITTLQDLFRLMEQASNYWAYDWEPNLVWIESRAECETNTRYALVSTARILALADVYSPTFKNDAVLEGMTLDWERHGDWLENQPETSTAVEIGASESFDGRSLGNVNSSGVDSPTTSNEVYIASRRNTANLTDVYTWSAANGWSANLMDAALPFNLLDTVGVAPAIGDLVLFGIDSTIADSGPFQSIVFDLATAMTGVTWIWEYWTGAAWAALTGDDNTNTGGNPLDTTGVNALVIDTATLTRGTRVENGVTAFWYRLRITAVPGPVVAPVQQNRDLYAVVWPYTEILSGQVGGDLSSLLKIWLAPEYDNVDNREVMVGLRSQSRGSDFTAYINLANEQNPTNITIAVGASTAFVAAGEAPGNTTASYSPPGIQAMASRCTATINAPLTTSFYGTFHVFLRVVEFSLSANFSVQLVISSSSGGQSITAPITSTGGFASQTVMDFGIVTLPLAPLRTSEVVDQIVFDVQAEHTVALAETLHFVDLILMPVDEWAARSFDTVLSATSDAAIGDRVLIDSITYPKRHIRSYVQNISTSRVSSLWALSPNGKAILQHNRDQRLWFAIFNNTVAAGLQWNAGHTARVQVERNQRYLGPRGSR
jgi:hypothetical protein